MKIFLIWAIDSDLPGDRWVIDAWDEYTIQENPGGWSDRQAALTSAYPKHALKVVAIEVPFKELDAALSVPTVKGEVSRG